MLQELCDLAGFRVAEIGYISHYFSQRATTIIRLTNRFFGKGLGWLVSLPLSALPLLFDDWLGVLLGHWLGRPGYSITLGAYKPRFEPAQMSPLPASVDPEIKLASVR